MITLSGKAAAGDVHLTPGLKQHSEITRSRECAAGDVQRALNTNNIDSVISVVDIVALALNGQGSATVNTQHSAGVDGLAVQVQRDIAAVVQSYNSIKRAIRQQLDRSGMAIRRSQRGLERLVVGGGAAGGDDSHGHILAAGTLAGGAVHADMVVGVNGERDTGQHVGLVLCVQLAAGADVVGNVARFRAGGGLGGNVGQGGGVGAVPEDVHGHVARDYQRVNDIVRAVHLRTVEGVAVKLEAIIQLQHTIIISLQGGGFFIPGTTVVVEFPLPIFRQRAAMQVELNAHISTGKDIDVAGDFAAGNGQGVGGIVIITHDWGLINDNVTIAVHPRLLLADGVCKLHFQLLAVGGGEGTAVENRLILAVDLHDLRAVVTVGIKGDGVGLHRAANAGAVFIIIGVGLGDAAADSAGKAVGAVTHGVAILIGGVFGHVHRHAGAEGVQAAVPVAGRVNVGQGGAAIDHTLTNAGQTDREGNGGQGGATLENVYVKRFHALRNNNAGQSPTAIERASINAGQAGRQINGFQLFAGHESVSANRRYPLPDGQGGDAQVRVNPRGEWPAIITRHRARAADGQHAVAVRERPPDAFRAALVGLRAAIAAGDAASSALAVSKNVGAVFRRHRCPRHAHKQNAQQKQHGQQLIDAGLVLHRDSPLNQIGKPVFIVKQHICQLISKHGFPHTDG